MAAGRLTEKSIRAAKPGEKSRKLSDGRGLFLLLNPNGSRWWRLKYRYKGKENQLSLGVYPGVPLNEARAECSHLRALLARDIDPGKARRAERAQERDEAGREASARYSLDSDGALAVRLPRRHFALTPRETADLRAFLDATRAVPCKGGSESAAD
ncbi:MAG: Arm DNA-binding domain-containing protein [Gammaproteobacteria bacterium]